MFWFFFLAAISEPVISANRRCGRENRNHHQGKLFIFYEESFVLCSVACKDPEVCCFCLVFFSYCCGNHVFCGWPGLLAEI